MSEEPENIAHSRSCPAIPTVSRSSAGTNGVDSGQGTSTVPPLPGNLSGFTLDWSEGSSANQHLWIEYESKEQVCYFCGEGKASSAKGARQRCMACKIAVHVGCVGRGEERIPFCRPTFRARDDPTSDRVRHHWLQQRKPSGRCAGCQKTFQQKFLLTASGSKEFVAVGCSWCKQLYHHSCFPQELIDKPCSLGELCSLILPPSWLVKLSSSREEPTSSTPDNLEPPGAGKKRLSRDQENLFFLQPRREPNKKPLLVFVNPKSGGNQGAKLLPKFLWLLNPRQVFNLLDGGPKFALQLYKHLPRLRILVCGGDGTVGWILSAIDELEITPCPPVAVLPIGTGNDLARTLNWGGGYSDEPIDRILQFVSESAIIHLDRWNLIRQPGAPAPDVLSSEENIMSVDELPLKVMNNYFSIGADALVTLEFHESREANPERFNSRWFNKMYYAGAGGRELLERKLRDLGKHLGVIADDVDITPRIREAKLTALVFLNIARYSAGALPWGIPSDTAEFSESRQDDGRIEIVGFTTMNLAALQMGSHGTRLAQCRRVTIVTSRTLPVQVDGEPCRLAPSNIQISLRNRATMLARVKRRQPNSMSQISELIQTVPVKMLDGLVLDESGGDVRAVLGGQRVHVVANPMGTARSPSPNQSAAMHGGARSSAMFYTNIGDRSDDLSPHSRSATLPARRVQVERTMSPVSPAEALATSREHPRLRRIDGKEQQPNNGSASAAGEQHLDHALVNACKQGNLDQVMHLEALGADATVADAEGLTPLHHAVRHNHLDIVRHLTKNLPKAALSMRDSQRQQTALHKAAWYGYPEIVQTLVKAGVSLSARDYEGLTAYERSLGQRNVDVSSFLFVAEQQRSKLDTDESVL